MGGSLGSEKRMKPGVKVMGERGGGGGGNPFAFNSIPLHPFLTLLKVLSWSAAVPKK